MQIKKVCILMLIILSFSNVYAVEEKSNTVADKYMSIDMAQSIIDYYKETGLQIQLSSLSISTFDTNISTGTTILEKMQSNEFANYFNNTFFTWLESKGYTWGIGENDVNFGNVLCVASCTNKYLNLIFFVTNNEQDNNMNFLQLQVVNNTNFYLYFQGYPTANTIDYLTINISTSNSYSNSQNAQSYLSFTSKSTTHVKNEEQTTITMPYMYAFGTIPPVYLKMGTSDYLPFHAICGKFEFESQYPGGNESGDVGGNTPGGDNGGGNQDIIDGMGEIKDSVDQVGEKVDGVKDSVDQVGEKIEDLNQNIQNGMDYFSGEGESSLGDMTIDDITKDMDFNFMDNPYQKLWDDIVNGIKEALTGTGEQVIEFDVRNDHFIIKSSQIYCGNENIKAFLSTFTNYAILMAIYITIQKIITKIQEGDMISVIHMGDAEGYFYDDLNTF